VHTLVKHLVVFALIAVAMLGGSELPALHMLDEVHAHSHAADAGTPDGQHHDLTLADVSDDHDHGDDAGHAGDRCCGHPHVHCCAATAILAVGAAALPGFAAGTMRLERNAALPYGQLSNPPLRPPRIAA